MSNPVQESVSVRLSYHEADCLLQALSPQYRFCAPVRFAGRGRFSDGDAIRYAEIRSFAEIVHAERSHFSPKEIVFPVTETLYYLTEDGIQEPAVDPRGVIVFLRACDIHGFSRLDRIFLENGPAPDSYYARLREKVKFVLLECRHSFDGCFCVSMGTNRTDEYAMAIRCDGEQIFAKVRDPILRDALPSTAALSDFSPEFVTSDPQPVTVPDPAALQSAIRERDFINHPLWEDYAKRCIACGRCNTHCVTCSCFSSFDVAYEEQPQAGERRRVWASCHIDCFTDMAGGHHFRADNGSRMRFKTLHKIYDFYQRFGSHMCVGCGRCDAHCPEYISFADCITRVSHALEETASHE